MNLEGKPTLQNLYALWQQQVEAAHEEMRSAEQTAKAKEAELLGTLERVYRQYLGSLYDELGFRVTRILEHDFNGGGIFARDCAYVSCGANMQIVVTAKYGEHQENGQGNPTVFEPKVYRRWSYVHGVIDKLEHQNKTFTPDAWAEILGFVFPECSREEVSQ